MLFNIVDKEQEHVSDLAKITSIKLSYENEKK